MLRKVELAVAVDDALALLELARGLQLLDGRIPRDPAEQH
jgi:hypothetical protein